MRQMYKQNNIEIGARIRSAREEIALTREQFAEAVGISSQFAADLERGRMGASLETICRICLVLGVPADRILLGARPKPGEAAMQIQAMLQEVAPQYHPYLIETLRSQIALIEAVEKNGTKSV